VNRKHQVATGDENLPFGSSRFCIPPSLDWENRLESSTLDPQPPVDEIQVEQYSTGGAAIGIIRRCDVLFPRQIFDIDGGAFVDPIAGGKLGVYRVPRAVAIQKSPDAIASQQKVVCTAAGSVQAVLDGDDARTTVVSHSGTTNKLECSLRGILPYRYYTGVAGRLEQHRRIRFACPDLVFCFLISGTGEISAEEISRRPRSTQTVDAYHLAVA